MTKQTASQPRQNQEAEEKNITVNRKARHEYSILQTFEAGIVLQGTEVKSLRQGKANLSDAYASLKNGEVWLNNAHISEYKHGNINNHDPLRERKLLLNKSEIKKLIGKVKEKVELALAKGKKTYDKREAIAKRDFERDQERRIKY
jgi:SsrA-binding protein